MDEMGTMQEWRTVAAIERVEKSMRKIRKLVKDKEELRAYPHLSEFKRNTFEALKNRELMILDEAIERLKDELNREMS